MTGEQTTQCGPEKMALVHVKYCNYSNIKILKESVEAPEKSFRLESCPSYSFVQVTVIYFTVSSTDLKGFTAGPDM